MKKKYILLAVTVGITALSACSTSAKKNGLVQFQGYPMQTQGELTYWMPMNANVLSQARNMGETEFGRALQEQTGVQIQFIHPPLGRETEQLNILLGTKDLPDVIETSWTAYAGGPEQAIREGILLPLNTVIDRYAPQFKKCLSENPALARMARTDNGIYYMFPYIQEEALAGNGPVVRKDWLERLGLGLPETIEDWHTMLTAFRQDMGASAPLSYSGDILKDGIFAGEYGLKKDFYVTQDAVRYGPAQPEYKALLQLLAQWYGEGLIDPEIETVHFSAVESNLCGGKTGAAYGTCAADIGRWAEAVKEKDKTAVFAAAPYPTRGKGERPAFRTGESRMGMSNQAAITAASDKVEVAARLLDFGYGEKGRRLYNFGIEGESYEMREQKPVYSDGITKDACGFSFTQALTGYTRMEYEGPYAQDVCAQAQYLKKILQDDVYQLWNSSGDIAALPPLILTAEESKEIGMITNNLNTYVNEMSFRYIKGEEDFSGYGQFEDSMEDFQVQRAIELYQNAYDRFLKRK